MLIVQINSTTHRAYVCALLLTYFNVMFIVIVLFQCLGMKKFSSTGLQLALKSSFGLSLAMDSSQVTLKILL